MIKKYKTKLGEISFEQFKTYTSNSYLIRMPQKAFLLKEEEIKELRKIFNRMKK